MFKLSTIIARYVCYNIYKFHENMRLHDFTLQGQVKGKFFLECIIAYKSLYAIKHDVALNLL